MTAHSGITLHHRAFRASVFWTLGLLLLGSIVHATESSLACPDWPTCFGTMLPEMTGGVFWEHLHRLVAGGLVILWLAGTWFVFKEARSEKWLCRAALAGLFLLIVQSVFGGLTVIMRLPDAVSTTHLGLAFLFLALATVVAVDTRPRRPVTMPHPAMPFDAAAATVRAWIVAGAILVYVQSLVGAGVRHTDSGLACPDIPLCLGEWIPPLEQWPIALHYAHRALGMLTVVVVLMAAITARRHGSRTGLVGLAAVLAVAQALLGFFSVWSFLAPWAVSLHTLLAASILAALVAAATLLSDRPTRGGSGTEGLVSQEATSQ